MKRAIFAVAVCALTAGTACTAIVIGEIGDKKDYTADASVTSTSGGPNGDDGGPEGTVCSLVPDDFDPNKTLPENACSTCIERSCSAEVSYACNGGKDSKDWFNNLRGCAKRPYDGFGPPEAGVANDSWGCTNYEEAGAPIIDNGSDAQHKRASEICVNQNCMLGPTPACHQCVVNTTKTGSNELAYLNADLCGKCFTDNCQADLVACCNTRLMQEVVTACAFTTDSDNKAKCRQLGTPDSGAGEPLNFAYGNDPCLDRLSTCYNTFCIKPSYTCETSH